MAAESLFCTQIWPPLRHVNTIYWNVRAMRTHLILLFHFWRKTLGISSVLILKYHDKTSCRPVWSVIILVNKQIELALRGRPISLITRVITDQIGFHSLL